MEHQLEDLKNKSAFTLLELSIVILIIGIIIAAVSSSSSIINASKIAKARQETQNSPIKHMDSVRLWLETTSDRSFNENETVDAETDPTSAITIWYDSNPNPDIRKDATSTPGEEPQYYKDCINHLPCLRFSTSRYMSVTPTGFENSDYSIFIVEQRRSNQEGAFIGRISNPIANSSIEIGYTEDSEIFVAQGGELTNSIEFTPDPDIPGFDAPIPRIHSIINSTLKTGSINVEHYLNGRSDVSNSLGSPTFSEITDYNDLVIGANNNGSGINYFDGDIGEIIFFDKALSQKERRSVEQYLLDKWNIERE